MQDSPPRQKRFPRRNGWGALLLSFAAVAALVWWALPAERNQPQPAEQEAATRPRLTSQATLSAGVVQLMVTGNAAVARGGADDLRRARSAFEQAIERDERYAPAHAGLAQALVQLAAGGAERAEQVLPLAVTHADRAIELDPAEALGWQALAQAEVQWTRDWPRAEMHYRRAVALAPKTEAPARLLAELLVATRRGEEAVAQGLSALELNPTSPALQEAIGLSEEYTHYMASHLKDPNSPDACEAFGMLTTFITKAKAAHVPMGTVIFPALWVLKPGGRDYPFDYLHEHVRAICQEQAIRCLDLFGEFARDENARHLWVNAFDAHPNAEANHRAAQEILNTFNPVWRH
jgi:tetratricopeptide (TPR) repeat protein